MSGDAELRWLRELESMGVDANQVRVLWRRAIVLADLPALKVPPLNVGGKEKTVNPVYMTAIAAVIAEHAPSGRCWASDQTIAERTPCSGRQVDYVLGAFRKWKWLERGLVRNGSGEWMPAHFMRFPSLHVVQLSARGAVDAARGAEDAAPRADVLGIREREEVAVTLDDDDRAAVERLVANGVPLPTFLREARPVEPAGEEEAA